nr:DUF2147 domain-containing protein [Sphingomonas japonica]
MGAAITLLATSGMAAPTPAPVTGRWLTQDKAALIAIAPCGASLCGKIVRVLKAPKGAPTTDANNPEPGLRARPLVGIDILSGFAAAGDEWKGRIYDPKSGKSYRSVLRREGTGALSVKGCIAFLCKTQRWTAAR